MKDLMEEDEDSYKRQFSRFIKLGITGDEVGNNFCGEGFRYSCLSIALYLHLFIIAFYSCPNVFIMCHQIEEIYKKAHAAIRADPSPHPKKTKEASIVCLAINLFVCLNPHVYTTVVCKEF